MRHLPIARPGAALLAACLMTTAPFASSQIPSSKPDCRLRPKARAPPRVRRRWPRHRRRRRSRQSWWARPSTCAGFYQDDKLEFTTDGKAVGNPQRGSFALSAVEIDKVKFNKHSMEIEAHRIGLHFFGALPYEDDSKPFERIKVDPKKAMTIEIDRLVIEPEKKKKKKDEKKDEKNGTRLHAEAARLRH